MLTSVARFCVRRRRECWRRGCGCSWRGSPPPSMLFMRLTDSNGGASSESARGSALLTRASSTGPMAVVLVRGPVLPPGPARVSGGRFRGNVLDVKNI